MKRCYDDYDMSPITDNGGLPWDPGAQLAWAKRAWWSIQECAETSALCEPETFEAAYVGGLALYFNDFEILAWEDLPDSDMSEWVDHLERNDFRLVIEAYKRKLIGDSDVECSDPERLPWESIKQLAISLREPIANAIIRGFGGKEKLLRSFLALDRANTVYGHVPQFSHGMITSLLNGARIWDNMLDDIGTGPDLEPLLNVAIWVVKDCPYLKEIRERSGE